MGSFFSAVGNELANAAFVQERLVTAFLALVRKTNLQAGVEERNFTQSLRQNLVAVLGGAEDLRVGLEGDARARLLGGLARLERRLRAPALVALTMTRPSR